MSGADAPLGARFLTALREKGDLDDAGPVVVAVSGGMDSCVLLHLMCFAARDRRGDLVVAHFDHGMRASSGDDARWVVGLSRAWGVPVRVGLAGSELSSEEAARDARYEFLEEVRSQVGGKAVLTGHHADDQAETVLFRLLRGTGQHGLAGIPSRRAPSIFRPLLAFWREELETHARRVGLSWREDPSNHQHTYARNVLRTSVIPEVERLVAPRARRALVRWADLAREDEAGWASVLPGLMHPLGAEVDGGRISVDRAELLTLHPAVRARVLRELAGRLGLTLGEAGTRLAVTFVESGTSGGAIDLGGSVALGRELDRVVLGAEVGVPADRPLQIPDPGPGSGDAVLAGCAVPVAWGDHGASPRLRAERFDPDALRFPLVVRARAPGDRIRLPGGTKKVKKLFLERRIPNASRLRVPLVVDAEGDVLWIPGVARAKSSGPGETHGGILEIGVG